MGEEEKEAGWLLLNKLLIVKLCNSQNSWRGTVRASDHFLTFVDKFDILLVCRSEALFLLVVCGKSRVMVLLTIQTVENYLGCREADEQKKRDSMSQAAR